MFVSWSVHQNMQQRYWKTISTEMSGQCLTTSSTLTRTDMRYSSGANMFFAVTARMKAEAMLDVPFQV